MPPKAAPPSLVKEANKAHDLFVNSWTGMKFNEREFGRACELMELKQLHRYVRAPGGAKGFFSFDAYVAHYTGGECSRTKIMECKRIYRLTQGEDAIPPEVVDQIPKKNLLQIARVKEHAPKKVTKSLIEKARKQKVNQFVVTAQSAINETKSVEEQKSPKVMVHLSMDPRAADMLKETIEDFKLIPGAVRDGDRSLDLDSKAILAICNSARSFAGDVIRAAKEKAAREAPEIGTEAQEVAGEEHETFSSPDAPVAIATATSEGRVIHRRSEARN
jgi:hypothetical protein